jgi:hypothetical protein
VPGIEGIAREDIPIYRYAEIREAIERNELILLLRVRLAPIFYGS